MTQTRGAGSRGGVGRPARVLVADDDHDFARSLQRVLTLHGYACEVAHDRDSAVAWIEREDFNLLVTDLDMPGNERSEVLYHASSRGLRTIVLTGFPTLGSAVEALRLGVVDYVTKTAPYEELIARVQRALEVRLRSAPPVPAPDASVEVQGLAAADVAMLSAREREIVGALAKGFRAHQIADALEISVHTVRNHLRSIFRKLGIHSQAELIELLRGDAERGS